MSVLTLTLYLENLLDFINVDDGWLKAASYFESQIEHILWLVCVLILYGRRRKVQDKSVALRLKGANLGLA